MKRDRGDRDPERSTHRLSRRSFLKASITGAAIAGTAGFGSCMTSRPGTPGSTPKFLASYRDAPNKGQRCAECIHFLKPNRCEIVAGQISPNGWCHYYKPRTA